MGTKPGASSARVGHGPAVGKLGPQLTQSHGSGQVPALQSGEQAVTRACRGDRRHARLDVLIRGPVPVYRHHFQLGARCGLVHDQQVVGVGPIKQKYKKLRPFQFSKEVQTPDDIANQR